MTPRGLGTVAVIGAGSSGLAAARQFTRAGFEVSVFEAESDLGGNWNGATAAGRVYRSTRTISSKPGTEFPDYPMPAAFPDYPHHTQILAYLRGYAEQFGLLPLIRFGARVERVTPRRDAEPVTGWDVTVAGVTRSFDGLVVANGHHWCPRFPAYPGHFSGQTLHSAEYRTPEPLAGRRVLVVGGGNSGCDIAVEAAQCAERVWHSTRRGYWYMPKYLLGKPADQVGDRLLALGAPLWVRRALARLSYRLVVGPPERTGLPRPDHRLFETHPIVNSLLPYYVAHGAITPKPDLARLDGTTVEFTDGSAERVDLIVWATGYRIVVPFLEERFLNWRDGRPHLYLHVFHPRYDTLFVAGLIQPDSGQFGLVHWQMAAAAGFARAVRVGSPRADRLRARKADPSDDLGHGIRYRDSARHHLEVEHWSYRKTLRQWARRLPIDD